MQLLYIWLQNQQKQNLFYCNYQLESQFLDIKKGNCDITERPVVDSTKLAILTSF